MKQPQTLLGREKVFPRRTPPARCRSTFELRIRSVDRAGGPGFQVHLLRSPAGDALGEIEDVDAVIDAFEQSVLGLPRDVTSREVVPEIDLETLGEALFAALFAGEVGRRWERCLEQVDERTSDRSLRVVLKCDPTCRATRGLARLPWELMRDPQRHAFLGLSRRTTMVRQLTLDDGVVIDEPPAARRLRILALLCCPEGVAPLDLAVERQKIEQAVAGRADIELEVLDNPTFGELTDRLRQESFHVLHYMGHGAFEEESGVGQLLMAGADGHVAPVAAERLAQVVLDVESLRLVVLNACDTGRMKRGAEQPFADLAGALLRSGVPAVIAMQTPIPDADAIELSRVFYRQLAAGESADEALAEARVAMYATSNGVGAGTWAVPVLFVRRPELAIFRPAPDAAVRPPSDPQPRTPGWRRRASVAASVLVALLVSALYLLPAPWAGIQLDVEASRVAFTLAESQSLFDTFAPRQLEVLELERMSYPDPATGAIHWLDASSSETGRLDLRVTAPVEKPAGLSLDDVTFPSGTRIEIWSTEPGRSRISLAIPADGGPGFPPELSASVQAGAELRTFGASGDTVDLPTGRLVFVPRSDWVHFDFIRDATDVAFHLPLAIEDLRFAETDEQDLPDGTTRVRTVSTLETGTVVLEPLGGGEPTRFDLDRLEGLDFEDLRGQLTGFSLGDQSLRVNLRGRAAQVSHPDTDGRRVELMPRWKDTPWALALATAAGAVTVAFTFLDRLRALWRPDPTDVSFQQPKESRT
jgi:hypothetical protein